MKVRDPDGQTWRVSRRWVPWRHRMRKVDDVGDLSGIGGGDIAEILLFLVLFAVLALLAPIVLPVVVAGIELVVLLLLIPFAVLGRVVLGRKWAVEVRRGWSPVHEELTGSWNDSGVRIAELAHALEQGDAPPMNLVSAPLPPEPRPAVGPTP